MSLSSTISGAAGAAQTSAPQQRWPYALLGFGSALFFYLHLFRFPFVPIWHDGDQAIYLEHAERMMRGELLYRDIFQFNLPGTEYLYELLFRCFGVHLWIGPLTLLVASIAVTLVVYALTRLVLQGAAAMVPPVAYLVFCQRASIDGSHHWYSTLLVLAAVYLVARARSAVSLGAVGALLALATLFTSSRGVLVATGISLFLAWSHREFRSSAKALAALLAPLAAVLGAALISLACVAGPKTLFDSVVIFPLHDYPAGLANNPTVYLEELKDAFPVHAASLPLIALWVAVNVAAPLVFVLFAVRCFRRRAAQRNTGEPTSHGCTRTQILVLYACAGGFALLAVISAPSRPRINCSAAFAYILAAALLHDFGKRRLIAGALVAVTTISLAEMADAVLRPVYVLDGPRGPVAFLHRQRYGEFAWVAATARPGDRLFGDIDLNFVLGLPNPAAVPWVESEAYTPPEQVTALVAALEQKSTRFISWHVEQPGPPTPEDSLGPFRAYIKANYHIAKLYPDGGEILVAGAPQAANR
jgi:hypothetical protein